MAITSIQLTPSVHVFYQFTQQFHSLLLIISLTTVVSTGYPRLKRPASTTSTHRLSIDLRWLPIDRRFRPHLLRTNNSLPATISLIHQLSINLRLPLMFLRSSATVDASKINSQIPEQSLKAFETSGFFDCINLPIINFGIFSLGSLFSLSLPWSVLFLHF